MPHKGDRKKHGRTPPRREGDDIEAVGGGARQKKGLTPPGPGPRRERDGALSDLVRRYHRRGRSLYR